MESWYFFKFVLNHYLHPHHGPYWKCPFCNRAEHSIVYKVSKAGREYWTCINPECKRWGRETDIIAHFHPECSDEQRTHIYNNIFKEWSKPVTQKTTRYTPEQIRQWIEHNNFTVQQLATFVRDDDDMTALQIMGDALEEAGCTDSSLLDLCRSGKSLEGEWALDVLGMPSRVWMKRLLSQKK